MCAYWWGCTGIVYSVLEVNYRLNDCSCLISQAGTAESIERLTWWWESPMDDSFRAPKTIKRFTADSWLSSPWELLLSLRGTAAILMGTVVSSRASSRRACKKILFWLGRSQTLRAPLPCTEISSWRSLTSKLIMSCTGADCEVLHKKPHCETLQEGQQMKAEEKRREKDFISSLCWPLLHMQANDSESHRKWGHLSRVLYIR